MRVISFFLLFVSGVSSTSYAATACLRPTEGNAASLPQQAEAIKATLKLTFDTISSPCTTAAISSASCSLIATDLAALAKAASSAATNLDACSSSKDPKLTTTDKDWYKGRSSVWKQVADDQVAHPTEVTSGTYTPSASLMAIAAETPYVSTYKLPTTPQATKPKPNISTTVPSIQCTSPAPSATSPTIISAETTAYADLQALTNDASKPKCTAAGVPKGCADIQGDLGQLDTDAAQVNVYETACSLIGKTSDGKTDLPASDKDWYKGRAALWAQIHTEASAPANAITISNGTYALPQNLAYALLVPFGNQVAAATTPPAKFDCTRDSSKAPPDMASTQDLIQKWSASGCAATPPPADPTACKAKAQELSSAVVSLERELQDCANNALTTGPFDRNWYAIEADNWQALDLDMETNGSGIAEGNYALPATWITPSHTSPSRYSGSPYIRAMLGGTFSGASGIDPQSKLLADVFADIPLKSETWTDNAHAAHYRKVVPWIWGFARIGSVGAAQSAVDPSQIVAAYANLSSAKPGMVVQSFETKAGLGLQIANIKSNVDMFNRVTLSIIAGGGALTPLSPSQTQPEEFQVNAAVEKGYPGADYGPCTTAATTTPASPYACYLQIYNQDRSRFFRDYELGFRFKAYPAIDPNHVLGFPAMFDVTFGENEYVTGGEFKGAVLHLGGSAPLLTSGLYAFGSMDVGIHNKADQPGPLLIPVDTTVTGIPFIPVAIPPYNRDRWTIGVGIDVLQLIRNHLLQDALSHK